MPTLSLVGLTFPVSAAFTAPSFPGLLAMPLHDRDNQCASKDGDQPYVARTGYYSDKDCTKREDKPLCLYALEKFVNSGKGSYSCSNTGDGLPDATPFWAKVEDTPFKTLQVVFTNDQTCPPNGPGAVFATLIDNQSCVEMNHGGTAPGVTVFPNRGATVNH